MNKLTHVAVKITDTERSRTFYEALGFSFRGSVDVARKAGEVEYREYLADAVEASTEGTNYFFDVGEQTQVLELRHSRDRGTFDPDPHFGFVVDDLDETVDRLASAGFEVEIAPYKCMGADHPARVAFVRDPDRNLIELISTGRPS